MTANRALPAPVGEVVRALGELGFQDQATLETLFGALGWPTAQQVAAGHFLLPQPPPREKPAPVAAPRKPTEPERGGLPSRLTTIASAQPEEPAWLKDSIPLPLPKRPVPLYTKRIEPLFSLMITRAILTRLAAAPAPVGEVDVERIVDTVARGRPMTALPRRTLPTLAKGLELLIDDGPGMDPLANDIAGLVDDLTDAVGRDRLTIRIFRGSPSLGVTDPATAEVRPYRAPPAGTPVLAVTDLGLAEERILPIRVAESKWLRFAADLRIRGNRLMVLTPYSPARTPPALRRSLNLTVWDRRTGARLANRGAPSPELTGASDSVRRLARLASLAGRIDPQLLRALRLRLAPDLGTEVEADLWFSDLVQSAVITGLVLRPEHQRALQDELAAADDGLLSQAWEILFQLRTDRPWSARDQVSECSWLVAQEELTYWGLRGLADHGPEREAAEARLKQILKTLITAAGSDRERDAIVWTKVARSRLPPAVLDLEPMQDLLLGAALRGAGTLTPQEIAETAATAGIPSYLLPDDRGPRISLWLRLVEGGLEVAFDELPQAHRIETLALTPLPLDLGWIEGGTSRRGILDLHRLETRFFAFAGDQIEIGAPDGTRYLLTRNRGSILINLPPPPGTFVDREQERAAALKALIGDGRDVSTAGADGPLQVFVSYAHSDEVLKEKLDTILTPLAKRGLIEVWGGDRFPPGRDLHDQIVEAFEKVDVILLILGRDFLSSEWGSREMTVALRRSAEGSVLLVPIIGHDRGLSSMPSAVRNVLPIDGRPIMDRGDPSSRSMVWLEIAGDLEKALRAHHEALRARMQGALRPLVVALTGPEGIGKFTLARSLVHDPKVQSRFSDGLIWLGEDGMGYPRRWLRDYCEAAGLKAPFDERDIIDKNRFRALFAGRRVLFIADHRSASDMLPTLMEHGGPTSTVLVLSRGVPSPPPGPVISVNPLASGAVGGLLAHWNVGPLRAATETAAIGNPLLLRIAVAAGSLLSVEALSSHLSEVRKGEPEDGVRRILSDVLPRLPSAPRHAALRLAAGSHPGSVFPKNSLGPAWQGPDGFFAALLEVGLLEDLGDTVRLHPLIRSALSATRAEEERRSPTIADAILAYDRENAAFGWRLWDDIAGRGIPIANLSHHGSPTLEIDEWVRQSASTRTAIIVVGKDPFENLDRASPWAWPIQEWARMGGQRQLVIVASEEAATHEPDVSQSSFEWLPAWDEQHYATALDRVCAILGQSQQSTAADLTASEADALLKELDRPETTHKRRLEIGERLDILGDPRYGVGIDASGTPQIDWCPVSGREMTLKRQFVQESMRKHVERFHIARYPITVAQYRGFLDAEDGWRNEGWWKSDGYRDSEGELYRDAKGKSNEFGRFGNRPAVNVSWFDAVAFCRWLSKRLGYEVGLPDEWEWQQAATGGDDRNVFPWGPDWDAKAEPWRANTFESRLGQATAVGMYPAGSAPTGALDMAGTVWEWCLNKFDTQEIEVTRSGANDFASRVLRGGSWVSNQDYARSANRYWNDPDSRSSYIGFRVVCASPSSDH